MKFKELDLMYIVKLIFLSAFLGLIINVFSQKTIPFIRSENPLRNISIEEIILTDSEIDSKLFTINLSTAKELFESKRAIFIDARDSWDYSDGNIPGAINIPEYKFDYEMVELLNKNAIYTVYCGGTDCDISKRLAEKLQKAGFKNVLVFSGGWEEWVSSGYEIDK